MGEMRKPFQGVMNIIRFNWHFYVIAMVYLAVLVILSVVMQGHFRQGLIILCIISIGPIAVSLLVSYYIYDLSGIYGLAWLKIRNPEGTIVNISAGFDETTSLLTEKFSSSKLYSLDFYDAEKHTEVSIKRARKAYPPYPGTLKGSTSDLVLEDSIADTIVVIFSAHEVRDELERVSFFKEISRVLKPNGQIVVTEHLRDIVNFMAYNIGFFHFYSKTSWVKTFQSANLRIVKETKVTPFISSFTLEKDGDPL